MVTDLWWKLSMPWVILGWVGLVCPVLSHTNSQRSHQRPFRSTLLPTGWKDPPPMLPRFSSCNILLMRSGLLFLQTPWHFSLFTVAFVWSDTPARLTWIFELKKNVRSLFWNWYWYCVLFISHTLPRGVLLILIDFYYQCFIFLSVSAWSASVQLGQGEMCDIGGFHQLDADWVWALTEGRWIHLCLYWSQDS